MNAEHYLLMRALRHAHRMGLQLAVAAAISGVWFGACIGFVLGDYLARQSMHVLTTIEGGDTLAYALEQRECFGDYADADAGSYSLTVPLEK